MRTFNILFAPLLVLGASLAPLAAQATPPAQLKTQAPGYQRLAVGDYEVTALFDGYNDLGPTLLKGLSQKEIHALLARKNITGAGVQTAFNAFLINTGKNLVLVDTGAGHCIGATAGGLPAAIRAAGYSPEQVDTILLTHMHLDHVCGLVDDKGAAVFANAVVYAAQAEADFWLSKSNLEKAPEEAKGYFKIAQNSTAPYVTAGRLKTFGLGEAPLAGVSTVNLAGHTPGSTGYQFTSNGQSILFMGDIIHSFAVQFAHPEVSIGFDNDSSKAIAARKKLFTQVAHDNIWVAAAHLPFPAIGHIRVEGKGFAWVPVEYGPYQRAANVPLLK
ncbi:MBL fold metallo-hydrolase [Pseudomonas turukhanskensis]|uniref:MBL fold metallo-hydrolase n=1 Tax=Pseudomonas turukhanskensis TaxID=1806536 RepID=A0A9W6NEI3_9PSED|nr:MBL fold metallo-hydrolase [Pseudomonas turukhanskensis]GLK88018.1 MBL fold metallo-hydrolase [Pseudomonas turukhanskensis]